MSIAIHSTVSGAGPVVVILHALFGSGTNWRGFTKKLSLKHEVHCIDFRNHGQSSWSNNMTYSDLANDVIDYLNYRNLRHVTLIGHSMGGKTAMKVSLNYPGLVENLVIEDMAPVSYNHSHAAYVQSMKSVNLERFKNRQEVDRQLEKDIKETTVRQFLLQNLIYTNDGLRWRLNLDAIDHNMTELMAFPALNDEQIFTGRALFVFGERSSYLTSDHYPLIRKHFPNAQISGIPRAGHWVHAEQPQMFFRNVDTFLSSDDNGH